MPCRWTFDGEAAHSGRRKASCPQLAFAHDPLMIFAGTLYEILELVPIVRELFGHFVDSARHVAGYDGLKAYDLTDVELM
jgi:hypothetical protein